MKQYQDFKKQNKPILLGFLLITIIIFSPFRWIAEKAISYAETAIELKQKINQKNDDIEKLELEIKKYQSELDSLGKQKNSLSNSIKELDITAKKLKIDISLTEKKIDKTNLKISELGLAISNKEEIIDSNLLALAYDIRTINELEEENPITILLSEKDFAQIWNDIENISTVGEGIRQATLKLKEIKVDLEDTKEETTLAKNELVSLKNKLTDQKRVIDQNAKEKQKLLTATKSSEVTYQKMVQEQTAKKLAFEKELRDFESQLQFILDPSKLPNAGVLSWPLDDIYVTQQFGAKTGPHRTYASGHSGVDFRARTPLPVKAMSDGVVKGIGDTDTACPGASFGKWIFIEYNNGLSSTYGHLSLIKVHEGQKVKRGEIVGYTGGTGRVTGPHLHVSVYVASAVKVETLPSKSCPGRILKQPISPINAYLDPMYYLPPYRSI